MKELNQIISDVYAVYKYFAQPYPTSPDVLKTYGKKKKKKCFNYC